MSDRQTDLLRALLPDTAAFEDEVVGAYGDGTADAGLPADRAAALSAVPAGTGRLRDFSVIAQELPQLDTARCVGCMECVTQCPDSALLAKVIPQSQWRECTTALAQQDHGAVAAQCVRTAKYYDMPARKGTEPGLFLLAIDVSKCKACGECVTACGAHAALRMVPKTPERLAQYRGATRTFHALPDTPEQYIQGRMLIDMMLKPAAQLYCGGGASCMGCGEATAVRMMLAATGFVYGADGAGIVAATGCNTVFGSTYPYNPYRVPWTNSLFENAPAVAMGIRGLWNAQGLAGKRLWVIGGDGAMLDIGFQSLSRMLMSGMDIKVLVLDTQVYSNTGGQASTGSFMAQDAKMAAVGRLLPGKTERRKELAQIAFMHPDVFVAQTSTAYVNHFYRAIMAANAYPGPALVNVYTPCQPEHGIADDAAVRQAHLAVTARAFPLLVYDPRAGDTFKERLSLQGNPARTADWHCTAEGEAIDFVAFARTEGRFAKQFDAQGHPSPSLLKAQDDRLKNWRLLQELAGVR